MGCTVQGRGRPVLLRSDRKALCVYILAVTAIRSATTSAKCLLLALDR